MLCDFFFNHPSDFLKNLFLFLVLKKKKKRKEKSAAHVPVTCLGRISPRAGPGEFVFCCDG